MVDNIKPTYDINVEVVDILKINMHLAPQDFQIHHNAFGDFDEEAFTYIRYVGLMWSLFSMHVTLWWALPSLAIMVVGRIKNCLTQRQV